MTGRKFAKSMVAAALCAAVIFMIPAGKVPADADSLSELQQKQSDLKKKGEELDGQLQKLKSDRTKQEQYCEALEKKSVNLEDQIDSKNLEISKLDADIKAKEASIASKQKEIDTDFQKLKKRVYALYLTGEASNLEIVLNAKNIMDLADKSELLRVISEHDTGLMNTLKADIDSIKTQKAEIEKSRKTASDARTSLEQQQQQLTALSKEAKKVLDSLNRNAQQLNSDKAEQEAALSTANQWLANYFSSSSKTAAASSGSVQKLISIAERYQKVPYLPGGSSPDRGFDCSGFVSYVLKQSGWSLGNALRMGVVGLSNYTKSVSSPTPGNLIFYWNYNNNGTKNHYDHVGIYLGNGQAIQCDSTGGVKIDTLSKYWGDYVDSYGRLP